MRLLLWGLFVLALFLTLPALAAAQHRGYGSFGAPGGSTTWGETTWMSGQEEKVWSTKASGSAGISGTSRAVLDGDHVHPNSAVQFVEFRFGLCFR